MLKNFIHAMVAIMLLGAAAADAAFPDYYPQSGFQRVGTLDDVQLDRQMIVINDIPYSLANSFIVHSTTKYSVPATRLERGVRIGYKTAASGRLITEIWLLPKDYENPQRR
jgi:hypothetical protein